jgi:phospholipid/cholesterol/gamma-HCH transport system permease protein
MASEGVPTQINLMTSEADNRPECTAHSNDSEGGGRALVLRLSGRWVLSERRPELLDVLAGIDAAADHDSMHFDVDDLQVWNTGLLIFVRACQDWAHKQGLVCHLNDLPAGVQNLVALSRAVAKNESAPDAQLRGWLAGVGELSLGMLDGLMRFFVFTGELVLDLLSFIAGRAQMRRKDFLFILQSTGVMAVPIVALLSFLTGLIIAFIGVIQLQKFAADIYVADLVGLAMTRELAAVMAGVIMAGRTGAAFAAQIGSMKVNEEIDALTTFGISPMQFLVLPRVIAMVLMMPLLCVCANIVSILGGMVVATTISDVSVTQYLNQIDYAVSTTDFAVGVSKSAVFGLIIAMAGCYRGLHCGKDASAVGLAATSAVVTSITWIVVADAVFAVMFHILGI